MSKDGIETYTQRKYARLQLDKHIEWHRAIDRIAAKLVGYKLALIFIGAGGNDANSPINIKKHVKCLGTQKLVNTFKRRVMNCVIRLVDEWITSQHCAECFAWLLQWTRQTTSLAWTDCDKCEQTSTANEPSNRGNVATDVTARRFYCSHSD